MKLELRTDFGKNLKKHDWHYNYSDDHRYWTVGRDQSRVLRDQHKQLECPFSMLHLEKWANNLILEDFIEDEQDEWYRSPRKYKCVAPLARKNLITRSEYDEVTLWLAAFGAETADLAQIA